MEGSTAHRQEWYARLPGFLREAEREGFIRDLRQWAVLAQALEYADDADVRALKYRLTALLAHSPEEQAALYGLYDRWFADVDRRLPDEQQPVGPKPSISEPLPKLGGERSADASAGRRTEPTWWQWVLLFAPFAVVLGLLGRQLGLAHPYTGLAAALTAALALWAIWRWRRRKIRVVRQQQTGPSDAFWEFRLPHRHIGFGPEFRRLATRLRERVPGDAYQINVRKTVQQTARHGDFPCVQLEPRSEMPSCLMLIDLSNDNNHRAALFDALYQYLKDREAPVERYFYRTLPRRLWNEEHPQGISLDTLAARYSHSRLFLLGDAWNLLDPATMRPIGLADTLRTWKDRILITPIPFPQWTSRERHLETIFLIAPFTPEGLNTIDRHLNPEEPFDWEAQRPNSWPDEAILFDENNLPQSLQTHFSDPALLQWLAALAFYPSLNWNLTLFLGDLIARQHQRPLLSFENLRQLSRIPWFYNGYIPENARKALYTLLDQETARHIHAQISTFLEEQRKHKEDYVSEQHSRVYLQILLHKALAGKASPAERRQLRQLAENEQHDFLIAQYTRTPMPWDWVLDSNFAFLIPDRTEWTKLPQQLQKLRKKIERIRTTPAHLQESPRSHPPTAKESPPPDPPPIPFLKPDMVFVRGGTFDMGCTREQRDCDSDEKPVTRVTVRDFYIGRYEVTFEEYDAFCAATGREKPLDAGWGRGRRPVIDVSWYDAVEYCNWLSEREGLTKVYTISGNNVTVNWNANGYRLPTEAEWEYAARGGHQSRGYLYSGSNVIDEVAWYLGNSGGKTHPVGQKKANELGLYDMSGNVYEWCWDWYGAYPGGRQVDYRGPGSGSLRVNRGGSWFNDAQYCRLAYRSTWSPASRYLRGFRLALQLPR